MRAAWYYSCCYTHHTMTALFPGNLVAFLEAFFLGHTRFDDTKKDWCVLFYGGMLARVSRRRCMLLATRVIIFPPFFCVGNKRVVPFWVVVFFVASFFYKSWESIVPNICVLYGILSSAFGWSGASRLLKQTRQGGSAGILLPRELERPRHTDEKRNDRSGLPSSIPRYHRPCLSSREQV